MTNITYGANAKIISVYRGPNKYGEPTFMLHLEWTGYERAFGPFQFNSSAASADYFLRLFNVVDTAIWNEMPGRYVRVTWEGETGLVLAIGHLVEDKWLRHDDPKIKAE